MLTPAQLHIVNALCAGRTPREIAQKRGTTLNRLQSVEGNLSAHRSPLDPGDRRTAGPPPRGERNGGRGVGTARAVAVSNGRIRSSRAATAARARDDAERPRAQRRRHRGRDPADGERADEDRQFPRRRPACRSPRGRTSYWRSETPEDGTKTPRSSDCGARTETSPVSEKSQSRTPKLARAGIEKSRDPSPSLSADSTLTAIGMVADEPSLRLATSEDRE